MAYLLCLVYIAVIYVRPAELYTALIPYHIAESTGVVAAAAAIFSVLLKPRAILNLPQDWCFLAFCLLAFLANPTAATPDRLLKTLELIMPLMGFYFLIRLTVSTRRQLSGLIVVLVALTVFQAANPILVGSSESSVSQTFEPVGTEEAATLPARARLEGTGIFGDPNDLAMSLLLVLPFLFSAILSSSYGVLTRLVALGALGMIGYGVFLTQSRGGFLGAAAVAGSYAYRRFGKGTAVVALLVVVAVGVATGPSRFQTIDSREASAQARVEAWAAGLQMLKSHPLLGVGFDQFTENHRYVAHNSFVHTFAEMGSVGGFCLVALFTWHFLGTSVRVNVAGAATSPLARDLWATAIGVVVTACFLSRQTVPVLYIPIAIGASRIAIEGGIEEGRYPMAWGWALALVWTGIAVVGSYVGVRLLGAWG
jgi:O-antigen ligase